MDTNGHEWTRTWSKQSLNHEIHEKKRIRLRHCKSRDLRAIDSLTDDCLNQATTSTLQCDDSQNQSTIVMTFLHRIPFERKKVFD